MVWLDEGSEEGACMTEGWGEEIVFSDHQLRD
jgi:hypothetical protein